MVLFKAFYGWHYLSLMGLLEDLEPRPCGTDILQDALTWVQIIQVRLRKAQTRIMRHFLSFGIGDIVFLLVTLLKGLMRFGKTDKLRPRYIGFFDILREVNDFGYETALPPTFFDVHLFLCVLILRRYALNEFYVLRYDSE